MANAISKTFGGIFLLFSTLLLLGGMAAAGFAFFQENQNHNRGLFADPQQNEQDQQLLMGGGIAAGAGVILLVLGLILVSVGRNPPVQVVMPSPAAPAAPAPTPGPGAAHNRSKRGMAWAAGIFGGILVLALIGFLATGGGNGTGSSLFGGDASTPGASLGKDHYDGTVENGASNPIIGSVTGGNNDHDLKAPSGTHRIHAFVNWTQAAGGTGRLEVIVTLKDGAELAHQSGGPGFAIDLVRGDINGAELHYQVFPADNVGAVAKQAFTIETVFWAE
jgi:hypothetical protein